ncbi:MAG: NAD(+)/NADH kinase [Oscillospiraceae bacterium]|nr:NAD(+)/NADH kinase [Oscillospiraceae bacterium]
MKAFISSRTKCEVYNKAATIFDIADTVAECDVVITIGGDGTILRAGGMAALHRKPLLGINTGRLGFMATLEANELHKLVLLTHGKYSTSRRMLLDVQVADKAYTALNDVVLHREAASHLSEVAVSRGETEVLRLRADGIVVATPTGSTAYSLSAGGPIIEPELECFVATAICPHCLFSRPMVFTASEPLRVSASESRLSIDGAEIREFESGGEVIITKSEHYLELIDIDGNSFYNSIHNKLMRSLK